MVRKFRSTHFSDSFQSVLTDFISLLALFLQEYLQPLEELQVNMKNRMEVGGVLRDLRLANIQCKFESEELATEQNFQVSYQNQKSDVDTI